MAHRKRSNQGVALTKVEWALHCARRVAVHAPERANIAETMVPGVKMNRLLVALRNAGVDMGRARRSSEGAIKAHKTIKAKKGKQK